MTDDSNAKLYGTKMLVKQSGQHENVVTLSFAFYFLAFLTVTSGQNLIAIRTYRTGSDTDNTFRTEVYCTEFQGQRNIIGEGAPRTGFSGQEVTPTKKTRTELFRKRLTSWTESSAAMSGY